MKKWLTLKERNNNIMLLAVIFSLAAGAIFEFSDAATVFYYCITGEDGYTWSEEVPYMLEMAAWAATMIVTALSALLAANKSRKWALLTIVLLAGWTVYSVSTLFLNCLILAVVWFCSEKRDVQLDNNKLLTVGIVLTIISFLNVVAVILYGISVDFEWLLLNLSLQLFVFLLKPEIVVMIFLYRNCKKKEIGYTKVRRITIAYFILWIMLVAAMLFANLTDSGVISGWFGEIGGADVEAGDWSEWTTLDEDGNLVPVEEDGSSSTYQTFEFD